MKHFIAVLLRKIRSLFIRIRVALRKNPDRFLRNVSGVLHIGANIGQERGVYDRYQLDVIWIEPNPVVFEQLKNNIASFPRQRAFQYLIADQDDKLCEFHIANNDGASSSILDLELHKDVWPNVAYEKSIGLQSITLASLIEKEQIDLQKFDALIIDTQGAELLVLQGAALLIKKFNFIKVEVPDFESYKGCCQLTDINSFLLPLGYKKISQHTFGFRAQGGCYYDMVYKRMSRPRRGGGLCNEVRN